jgi:hypothetical protein
MDHWTKYNILSTEKHGFRTNWTTENATYKLTNVTLYATNNKLTVGGIFSNIKKIFQLCKLYITV